LLTILLALLDVNVDANRIRYQGRMATQNGNTRTAEGFKADGDSPLASVPLVTRSGAIAPSDALNGKVVAMYFSAHWCGPCRQFTPALRQFYEFLKEKGEKIEIVFISFDGSEVEFEEYFHHEHGDWLAVQYGSSAQEALAEQYQVRGIPTLIVVDSKGTSVVPNAVGDVMGVDSEGAIMSVLSKWKKVALPSVEEPQTELHPGDTVQISGVQSRASLNGQQATCLQWSADRGRWQVKLQSGEVVGLKLKNLKLVEVNKDASGLQAGDPVAIIGLQSKPGINGQQGSCEEWMPDRGRWRVRLQSGGAVDVKPANLKALEASTAGGPLSTASLVTKAGAVAPANALEGKVVAIYFSAHWCPPCRQFTPALRQFYETLKASGEGIEIVFVSSDQSEAEFEEYFHNHHGDWLAVQYGSAARDNLNRVYQVRGIPTLIVVDKNGVNRVPNAVEDVMRAAQQGSATYGFASWKRLAGNWR